MRRTFCLLLGIWAFSPCMMAQQVQIPTGAIAYYSLNGNGNESVNGTVNLTPTGLTAASNRLNTTNSAYNFNGTTGALSTNTAGNYHAVTGNTISISLWYRTTSTNNNTALLDNTQSSNGYGIDISSNNIRFLGGGNWNTGVPLNTDGAWHHIALVKNGSAGALYIDGIISATTTALNTLTAVSSTNFTIGRNNSGTGFFTGELDDIRIYNTALMHIEAWTLCHENDYNRPGAGLIAHYPLDNNGNDFGIEPVNLTVRNTPTAIPDRYSIANSAYHFDAVGNTANQECLNLSDVNPTHIVLGDDITIAFWYRTTSINNLAGIVDNSQVATGNGYGIDILNDGLRFIGGGPNFATTIRLDTTNTWRHVTFVKDNNLGTFYVDGVVVATANNLTALTLPENVPNFSIARRNPGHSPFDGDLDDIRIYNTALTEEEVNNISCQNFSVSINTFTPNTNTNDRILFNLSGTFPITTQTFWAGGTSWANPLVVNQTPFLLTSVWPENYYTVFVDSLGCRDTLYFSNAEPPAGPCQKFRATVNNFVNNGNCGDEITLNLAGTYPMTIQIFGTNGSRAPFSTTTTPITIDSLCPDQYYVIVEDFNGCRDTLYFSNAFCSQFSLSINTFAPQGNCSDQIILNLSGAFPMNTQTFWAGGAGGGNTLWANASPYTISGLCEENYYTVVTDAYFCRDTVFYSNVMSPRTAMPNDGAVEGISEIGLNSTTIEGSLDIKVFPNPAKEQLTLQASIGVKYVLLDITGKELHRSQSLATQHQVDVSGLAVGMYILRITDGKNVAYQKVLVQE